MQIRANIQDNIEDSEVLTNEYQALLKKHNYIIKQFERTSKSLNEKDQQLIEHKKRERLLAVDKRLLDTSQTKISVLAKKIESKDEIIKNFTDQIELLKKENHKFKYIVNEREKEIKALSAQVFEVMEQASLYKEMAVFNIFNKK